jgi:hypothetical protein
MSTPTAVVTWRHSFFSAAAANNAVRLRAVQETLVIGSQLVIAKCLAEMCAMGMCVMSTIAAVKCSNACS